MADPGPQSSVASAVPVAVGDAESDVAVVPVGDADVPLDVAGGVVPCGGAHDVTVVSASRNTKTEPITVDRLWGWNISVAFRRWNQMTSSNGAAPPSGAENSRGAALVIPRLAKGAVQRRPVDRRGLGSLGADHRGTSRWPP